MTARGQSRRLARALVDFGVDVSFAAAATKVQEHYGVTVAPQRVRRVCLQTARRLPPPPTVGALPAQGPAHIVTEIDGTLLPMVDTSQAPAGSDRRRHRRCAYQEVRLSAARAHGRATTAYGYSRSDPAAAGLEWARTTQRAGWALNSRIHALGDGAPWIVEQARIYFANCGSYLVDLYHVCDYLAAAAPTPDQSRSYVQTHRQALLENRGDTVLAELAGRLEPAPTADAQAPVRCAHRYLTNRLDQLDYAAAVREHLPVGSGLIEGGHRHVLQARFKLSGCWWLPSTIDDLAALRILRANGLWESVWRN